MVSAVDMGIFAFALFEALNAAQYAQQTFAPSMYAFRLLRFVCSSSATFPTFSAARRNELLRTRRAEKDEKEEGEEEEGEEEDGRK